jgi:hypothetical protein
VITKFQGRLHTERRDNAVCRKPDLASSPGPLAHDGISVLLGNTLDSPALDAKLLEKSERFSDRRRKATAGEVSSEFVAVERLGVVLVVVAAVDILGETVRNRDGGGGSAVHRFFLVLGNRGGVGGKAHRTKKKKSGKRKEGDLK